MMTEGKNLNQRENKTYRGRERHREREKGMWTLYKNYKDRRTREDVQKGEEQDEETENPLTKKEREANA